MKLKSTLTIVALVLFVLSIQFNAATRRHERTCTITDKYVKNDRNNSRYLVVCDNETYKIEDDMLEWKFNSSDIYAKIKVGNKYNIKTKGTRIVFFSEYENINEVSE